MYTYDKKVHKHSIHVKEPGKSFFILHCRQLGATYFDFHRLINKGRLISDQPHENYKLAEGGGLYTHYSCTEWLKITPQDSAFSHLVLYRAYPAVYTTQVDIRLKASPAAVTDDQSPLFISLWFLHLALICVCSFRLKPWSVLYIYTFYTVPVKDYSKDRFAIFSHLS